jgi:hypothetical protein
MWLFSDALPSFQEIFLSPRCLVFLEGLVYFACSGAVWAEHFMAETLALQPTYSGDNPMGKVGSKWPLRLYAENVSGYTSRNLTYQFDGLKAFSGILSTLSLSMNLTTWVYGLPTCVFDWACLWTIN